MSKQNVFFIDPNNKEASDLLTMFWGFHDFRVRDVHCSNNNSSVDVYLEYDSDGICVLLRFGDVLRMNYVPAQDYQADWLGGSRLFIGDNETITWIACDDVGEEKPYPDDVTWIQSKKLYYAMVDSNNNPIDIPENIRHQTWHVLNYQTWLYEDTEYHFSPKPVK